MGQVYRSSTPMAQVRAPKLLLVQWHHKDSITRPLDSSGITMNMNTRFERVLFVAGDLSSQKRYN